MKLGMMCLWNAANGPAVHAELVGREWVRAGHTLRVFSPVRHPDARPTLQEDEPYVIRHFTVHEVTPLTRASGFDPSPIVESDYEVFIAQNVERLPAEKLLELFPRIRERAATVMVVHEGRAPDDPLFYRFQWDAIVCFDDRYREYLVRSFPAEIIHMIPYPYHPLELGNRREAREGLGLPMVDKIVFSFGFRPHDIVVVLPRLAELAERFPLRYLVIANPGSDVTQLRDAAQRYRFLDLQVRPLPREELYRYLHASDALLIHRESSQKYHAVVSSSVSQVLGAGCPIVFHESNFVELHGDEIIKYRDFDDLKDKLIQIFSGRFDVEKVKSLLEEHSAEKIAARFVQLFQGFDRRRQE